MEYTCTLDGEDLHCVITADRPLKAPMFCFSGMAPMTATAGGQRISGMGSFTEVALPDLAAGEPHTVTLRYSHGYKPANRAWMPLGPYLRTADELIALPPTRAGCDPIEIMATAPFEGLSLLPQPSHWAPTGEVVSIDGLAINDQALQAVADLAARRGFAGFAGTFPVTIETADLPEDAYTLSITPDGVTIGAASYGGRFYAGITLLTLMQHGPLRA